MSAGPGAIVITRIPWRASSRAIGKVMETTSPLDAEYAACDLSLVGGVRGGVDDDAALAVLVRLVAGDLRSGEADDVEGSGQVDLDHRSEEVEREGPSSSFPDHARRRADARTVHGAVQRVE